MELSKEKMRGMYYKMWVARIFEESVNAMFMKGMIHGTTHLSVGEEGTAVGVMSAIRPDDYMMSCHRGHSHCIAKDADVNRMMCELLGRRDGFCKGMGGSMHIVDFERRNLGANGIMGPSIPIATGVALALKKSGSDNVVVSFFGDGTSNSGLFHEAINMGALWKLPIVYICENNLYGMSTPVSKSVSVPNIADRAAAYGIPGVIVDGNDVLAVMAATEEAAERARRGEGPTLLELKTYRWLGHSKSDKRAYRTREEEEEWKAKCPIRRFGEYMLTQGFTEAELEEMHDKAKKAVEDATDYALHAEKPTLEEAMSLVFVNEEAAR